MERKTYEAVMEWKDFSLNDIKSEKIIVSSSMKNSDITVVRSPREALERAKTLGFNHVLLSGGGILNSVFLKENLIDEIILNIDPYILGKGINIFQEDNFEKNLKLVSVKKLKKDIVQVKYKAN